MNEFDEKRDSTDKKPTETAKALPKSSLDELTSEAGESDLAEQFYTVATTCW